MFRRALLGILSATAAGALTLALAGPANAAPLDHCDPPGLTVAIGNDNPQADHLKAVLVSIALHNNCPAPLRPA